MFSLPLVTVLAHVRVCPDSVAALTFESLGRTVVLPREILIGMLESFVPQQLLVASMRHVPCLQNHPKNPNAFVAHHLAYANAAHERRDVLLIESPTQM